MNANIRLGDVVKDDITGFKGTVTGLASWLYSPCSAYVEGDQRGTTTSPTLRTEGTDGQWIECVRLTASGEAHPNAAKFQQYGQQQHYGYDGAGQYGQRLQGENEQTYAARGVQANQPNLSRLAGETDAQFNERRISQGGPYPYPGGPHGHSYGNPRNPNLPYHPAYDPSNPSFNPAQYADRQRQGNGGQQGYVQGQQGNYGQGRYGNQGGHGQGGQGQWNQMPPIGTDTQEQYIARLQLTWPKQADETDANYLARLQRDNASQMNQPGFPVRTGYGPGNHGQYQNPNQPWNQNNPNQPGNQNYPNQPGNPNMPDALNSGYPNQPGQPNYPGHTGNPNQPAAWPDVQPTDTADAYRNRAQAGATHPLPAINPGDTATDYRNRMVQTGQPRNAFTNQPESKPTEDFHAAPAARKGR